MSSKTPRPITLIGPNAIGCLEPLAYRRPGGRSTIKFAARLGSEIVVRECREDALFRRDVDAQHAELCSLGFFAEARKLLLYCDAAQSSPVAWDEKAVADLECESRERVVQFADYREFSRFKALTAEEVCRTFEPKSKKAPKEITYFVRWAPEVFPLGSKKCTWS